jgi:hypothetical protein
MYCLIWDLLEGNGRVVCALEESGFDTGGLPYEDAMDSKLNRGL